MTAERAPGCVYGPAVMPAQAGILLFVIYGQEVLYAARGQDARSRPAKAGIQWFRQAIPAQRE